jgi:DNA-binding LacI/PurR family transcriptional regulator
MKKQASSPTAKDVALLADVSPAAVSYVLSGRRTGNARISEETRQRILDASAKLRYVPNQAARNLRRKKTDRICLVLPTLGVPYHDLLANELNRAADAHGYSVIIAIGGTPEREAHILQQLQRRFADGVVLLMPSHIRSEDLTLLAAQNIAVVAYSNHLRGFGFDTIRTTEWQGVYSAVRYLMDKGHQRIAFLGHCASSASCDERLDAFRQAFETPHSPNGVNEPLVVCGENTREQAYRHTQAFLRNDPRPTAIFAASDLAAISAIWAIRDAGLRAPQDVAVIGVGNIPEGEITRPALTTVGPSQLNFSDIPELLFSRLRSDTPLTTRVVEQRWRLISRDSA